MKNYKLVEVWADDLARHRRQARQGRKLRAAANEALQHLNTACNDLELINQHPTIGAAMVALDAALRGKRA